MIEQILSTIREGRRFLVASHENPDGDAIGSTLALANALREMGKEVVAYNQDGVPNDYRFLPGWENVATVIPDDARFDAGFVLDAGELSRAGSWIREACRTLANIDHHPHSDNFGEIYWVDENASATGVMVYRLLQAAGWPISQDVATCIYTTILSDTGSFRYSNADPEAFRVAGEMVALGVDPWSIASGLYESQEESRLRLLALALPTLDVAPCGTFAAITVTNEMLAATGCRPEHTDRFVNYPRSVRGVEVAIFFRQTGPDSYKVGFRSKGRIDVGALAREFGGGGHHNAAGAVVEGSLQAVRDQVFSRLGELLSTSR
ncbi:MAG: bifunctional oligoribonuclease/PAP phosphatase NrnA [Desulfuromonadales bacterium]|nr:bifunctional oligoribonuclease/PAP phosphatase NrnA [Desulfuromonadales bacterium]